MIYLLDANVLVDSNRDFYPMDRVPEFWEWLHHQASSGIIKIPEEIFIDLKKGNDLLAGWAKNKDIEKALKLELTLDGKMLQKVLADGYSNNLTDTDIQIIGSDAYLISYALTDKDHITIVTTESSKPSKEGANKHIPDVCDILGVKHCTAYKMFKVLDFRTAWKKTFSTS